MTESPRVVLISFHSAPLRCREHGLLGWMALEIGGTLVVDGVTLRRTQFGRLMLSFPSRWDRRGVEHPILRPANAAARELLERTVLEQLRPLSDVVAPARRQLQSDFHRMS